MSLGPDSFAEFFRLVHGQEPFRWQVRLARQVASTGSWPDLLDLPTGCGKTSVLDIAVFHLACEADRGPRRRAPVRILFVIDRRIVVDAAFDRARRIAAALRDARDGLLGEMAERLRRLAGTDVPLDTVRLRGGIPQERDWARSPAQPLVAVSTVDQAGSRLLFRGYGVSPRMWPVHAGLVGADALWFLDEVHLSRPLEETLAAIVRGHPPAGSGVLAERPRLAPFGVVRLSATPGASATGNIFRLNDDDHRDDRLRGRLTARKLAEVKEFSKDDPADDFVDHALSFAGLGEAAPGDAGGQGQGMAVEPAQRVGVVVNRVDLARRIHEKVSQIAGARAEVVLLTGRIRPLDRDALLTRGLESLLAAPNRPALEKPVILVATQTVEAGADLDVDALVTEIAPLDVLRQRFGRLDRLGERGVSRAMILCPADAPPQGGPKARENPWTPILRIYGEAAYKTKQWLKTLGSEIDFGVEGLRLNLAALTPEEMEKLLAPHPAAPVLLPPYVDLWAATSPAPTATPEPSLSLHGPGFLPEVQVVWRVDPHLRALEHCPPSALEAVPVPVWAVRRWLLERREEPVADVPESSPKDASAEAGGSLPAQRVWCWDWEGERWRKKRPGEIRAGDLIVVPAAWGGCDRWGWNPRSQVPVADLGAEAHYLQRRRGAICVTPETLENALGRGASPDERLSAGELWRRVFTIVTDLGDDPDAAEAVRAALVAEEALPATWRRLLSGMEGHQPDIAFYEEAHPERGFVLYTRRLLAGGLLDGEAEGGAGGAEAVTGAKGSSAASVEVLLRDHQVHVERWARTFAASAGLDERLTYLVGLAARLHDLGKAEPRFQADLRGTAILVARSAELAALWTSPDRLLAKSVKGAAGHAGTPLQAAPDHFRHEALSVALAAKHPEVEPLDALDRDLVLWLIGTHHGFGRPFFPPCLDPWPHTPVEVEVQGVRLAARAGDAPIRLDQGWCERAQRLQRHFGPWELARLEVILRLGDHAASAEEQGRAIRGWLSAAGAEGPA